MLGKSVWTDGFYNLFGEPYAKHLPLHAIVSYPLVASLGPQLGMKMSSLISGFGVLVMSFLLLRRTFSLEVAVVSVIFLVFHHAFVLMTILGSADLLFTFLFLASVFTFLLSKKDKRWYFAAFVLLGLASLARYNGVLLFAVYPLTVFFDRRRDFLSRSFIISFLIGAGIFGLWFLRSYLVFGDPFFTEYSSEFKEESIALHAQIIRNIFYYIGPFHNLLPILFLCSLYGLWKRKKENAFLIVIMCTLWVLAAVWWVQAMRFAFPGYTILMGFASWGLIDILRKTPKAITYLIIAAIIVLHSTSLCLYAYGECNSCFDKNVGHIPPNLHISSEGFHTWDLARNFINDNAEENGFVLVIDPVNEFAWKDGVFRGDLTVTMDPSACPLYRIMQNPSEGEIIFTTVDEPKTSVIQLKCSN